MVNGSNVSTISTQDLSNNYMYIGFGSAAVITNVIVIIILSINKAYFSKSAFTAGLAAGDIINGVALVITGVVRINQIKDHLNKGGVHPLECLKGFTTLWLLGIQLPSVMMLLIGMERVLATVFFVEYYKKWSNKIAWLFTLMVYIFCALSVGTSWIISSKLPTNATVSVSCTTPSVIGEQYSTYNYGLAIMCGMISIVFTIVALVVFVMKKSHLKVQQNNNVNFQKFVRRQWHVTVSMAVVCLLDFAVVVLPNVFLLMISYKVKFPPSFSNVGYWSASLVCLRASLSLFVYLLFNRDFRQKFFNIIGYRRKTAVQPVGGNPSTKSQEYDTTL